MQAAKELAKRLGLRHVVVPDRTASASENALRLQLAGYSIDAGSFNLIGDHRQVLDPSRLQVTGNGGHMGRSTSWPDSTLKTSPETIVDALRLPRTPKMLSAATAWREELPHLDGQAIVDLTFLEVRLAGWAGPNQYAIDGTSLSTLFAFSQREFYGLMMRLPGDYRKSQAYVTELCRRAWPQVLEVPVNRAWGATRLMTYAERVGKKLHTPS